MVRLIQLALSVALLGSPIPTVAAGAVTATVSACFAPAEACTPPIVEAIDGARRSIRVQAYGFTSAPILRALLRARTRGVDVQVILDKSNLSMRAGQPRYTGAVTMANAGIPTWIDSLPGIAHNKVIVIDDREVVGGSFNYTASADRRNAENVTFTTSAQFADWFTRNWQSRQAASEPFKAGP